LKKYLVIQTAFIGDAILATAVLEKLHQHDPSAVLDVLVRKGNESLFDSHPFIRKCYIWNKKENKYRDLFSLINAVRKESYDSVINLQRFAASGLITAFSGAKEKIGFDKNPLSFFYDKRIPHVLGALNQPMGHEVDRCLKVVEHITGIGQARPKLYPSNADFEKVAVYTSERFITISPASVWFTKQTPDLVWCELLEKIGDMRCYLLGAPADVALCERIAASGKNVVVLAGKLSLLQSAALMSKAAMNYTNDSAPLHLCSAMNAPVTAVFCSTIPEFGFGPLSENGVVIESDIRPDCKPCGLHGKSACPMGHFDCGKINSEKLYGRISL
jgi:ADP-heptose:LPS heptosyltransferase